MENFDLNDLFIETRERLYNNLKESQRKYALEFIKLLTLVIKNTKNYGTFKINWSSPLILGTDTPVEVEVKFEADSIAELDKSTYTLYIETLPDTWNGGYDQNDEIVINSSVVNEILRDMNYNIRVSLGDDIYIEYKGPLDIKKYNEEKNKHSQNIDGYQPSNRGYDGRDITYNLENELNDLSWQK